MSKEFDQLKQEYQSIPIPEELEGRVRAAIRQAEGPPARSGPAKRRRIFRPVFGACAAAMLTVVVLANSTASIAHAMSQIPVLGAITKVVTFRTFQESGGAASAKIDVPEVADGGDLNDEIQRYTDAIIAEYKRDAAITEEYAADPDAPAAETNHYALDLSYTVATDNDTLFALRFDKTVIMNSGTESVKIYNVDKASGKIITLADLFQPDSDYLDLLTRNIQAQMQAQMDADENVSYWLNHEVTAWNFTALDPGTAFYVNEAGQLVIVFNEGDVAPMYMGVVEFTIPSEALGDAALPKYLK